MQTMIVRDAQEAFKNAIEKGNLSTVQAWENFAGKFMYMYSDEKKDFFKNKDTRHFLAVSYAS